jgi:2-phospho-L-lactate/phosphoenolpyruvate guanylyltransferase
MIATAILPVKRLAKAKKRLGTGMGEHTRRDLVLAMAGDVLDAIGAARTIERTLVVTSEPAVEDLAAAAGAEVIPDPTEKGHPEAALIGIEQAVSGGARCVVLLPGDCPLLDPRELDGLLTGVPERYVGVVPDRHRTGTNALVLSPPVAIRPAFGEGSLARHLEAAREAGIPHAEEDIPSLALDLDTPADVIALTTALDMGGGSARRTARALGI